MIVEHESMSGNSCNHVLKPLGKKCNEEYALISWQHQKLKNWEQEWEHKQEYKPENKNKKGNWKKDKNQRKNENKKKNESEKN